MTRLHPLSIPYRVTQAVLGYVPLVFFAAIASGPAFGGIGIALAALAILVGFVAAVAWQLAYYKRFEYETTPDTFDIHSGVVSRRNREIPYRRVQNVDISRNVVQRALGIAELRIETAGGGETEAILRYVGYEEAKRLQNELRRRKRAESTTATSEGSPADKDELLYAITPEDLAVLAVASFDLRLASFLSVLLSFAGPPVLLELLTDLPISPFLVVGAVIVLVVVVSALLSGASAFLSTYGFRLTRSGDELRYERGLVQRFDGSIPLDKVQLLALRENLLKRLLGYASLAVETAGYAPGQDGSVGSESAVPIADRETTWSIARRIEPFEGIEIVRPPKRARRRYAFRYLLALGVLAGLVYAGTLALGFEMYWYALLIGVPLAPVAAHYKWKSRGYFVGEDHVVTRTGFWNRTTRVVPYYRVQNAIHTQTILQRRWRLASVVIDTAGTGSLVGGDAHAIDLDEEDATDLRETVADRLQTALQKRTREATHERRQRRVDRALPRFEDA
ncbi:bacterial membrane flanked domain protein [Halalkalicoccus paucihalophilus]|uniref:Bacterial membrane flanked domain protein n=1 Tax=Halalkalicoccus paucihalophilus TaxID=1008153 RepID=A0A151ACP5_9EURY|nr:PH domain-containing protein [Halalkalicoccus paucihalophilus]KYH25476.1 bacterial membrane flanked domain protein [Halalkalicoccus paucihalophilus]